MDLIHDEAAFRRWWRTTATKDQRSLLFRVSAENAPIPAAVLDALSSAGVVDDAAPWPATQDDPDVYLSPELRRLVEYAHSER